MRYPDLGTLTRRPVPALIGSAAMLAATVTTAAVLHQTSEPADAHTAKAAAPALATAAPGKPADPPAPDPLLTSPEAHSVDYDFQFQPNYYYCGPASTRMALTSSGVALSQGDLAARLGTTVNGTNSAADVTRAMNGVLGKDEYRTRWIPGQQATGAQAEQLQRDAVAAMSSGRAVVANIVGGATDESGVYHEFSGGHYITLVGYRDRGRAVQVADPSGMFGSRTYWMSTWNMANWIAARGYSA
ncbi:C39 family peptidase [Dactylosporangium sp. NPDC051485]|uniref:C39 family peptidase n=1 Tax=Dactylosporangium sp. NPDC051485 TaxID=3154846 RepID=UPI00341CE525